MKNSIKAGIASVALLVAPLLLPSLGIGFRAFDHEGYTRVVIEGDRSFAYKVQDLPDRLEVRLGGRADFRTPALSVPSSQLLERVTCEVQGEESVLTVHYKGTAAVRKNFVLEKPFRLVFDLVKSARAPAAAPADDEKKPGPAPAEPPPAARPKPIETICIDPGHGGEDLGAVGRSKLQEKNITLKIGIKLKKLIESRTGLRVIMTRDKDSEVSLNTRASIANNQRAQMFVSIHVNSSFRKSAYGSETFFVSLQATDPEALELAQKENQNQEDPGEAIQNDELKMILWNMAQTEHIRESSKLAEYIQNELNELLGTRNRGVKQAPFRVLMRTAMPAVLIEAAFISNASEEKKLQNDEFLERIALAIYNGISKFIYYYNSIVK
ncbi:MAG: N-acetylmuramoyl-L-alanine amidase [Acidobacteria bacterium]|jgi:N-acetylmuramoyl-L-alanine amidase|nr:N-acetylmuramoyl-L-alanine amidase [Acidobacteriota bacterium]